MAKEVKSSKRDQKFDTVEDISDLLQDIQNNEDTLETLVLGNGNSYGIEVSREIGSTLQMCNNLKHLLFDDMFKGRLKTEIPQALGYIFNGVMGSQARIETLDLNDNAIGPVTMPALTPFLESISCSDLKVLRLNNCGLGIQGGKMLAAVLPSLENLEELIIGRNRLEIDGIREISLSLLKLNKLKRLEIPQNGSKENAIIALSQALQANTDLRILNLNDNVLRTTAAQLAEAVKKLKSIEVINLGDCLLKTNGCIVIMDAIRGICEENNKCYVQQIIMNGNEIGVSAFDSIVATIEAILKTKADNSRLKLDLSANNLGETLITQFMERFSTIIDLTIEDDDGSDIEEGEVTNESIQIEEKEEEQQELSLEELIAKFESDDFTLDDLCRRFYKCSLSGFQPDKNELNEQCVKELEAIIQACKKKYSEDNFMLVNSLLVACGLIKNELTKCKSQTLNIGTLFALAHVTRLFTGTQKLCISQFLKEKIENPDYGKYKVNLCKLLYSF